MKLHEIAEEDLPIVLDILHKTLRSGTQIIVYSSATGQTVRCWPLKSFFYDPKKNVVVLSFVWGGSTPMEIQFSMAEVAKWKLIKGDGEFILHVGQDGQKPSQVSTKKSRKLKEAVENPDAPIAWDILNKYLEDGKEVWVAQHGAKHHDAAIIYALDMDPHTGTNFRIHLKDWVKNRLTSAGNGGGTHTVQPEALEKAKFIRQDGHILLVLPFLWHNDGRKFDPSGWTWQKDHWEHDNPKDRPPIHITLNKLHAHGNTVLAKRHGSTYKLTTMPGGGWPLDLYSSGNALVTWIPLKNGKFGKRPAHLEIEADEIARSTLKQVGDHWEWDLP